MPQEFDFEQAQQVIEGGTAQAQDVMDSPQKLDELFAQLQEKVKDLPATLGSAVADVPAMIAMVRGYVTREYTDVSPKVVVLLVSAFLYLVKGRDIIPDSIPIIGMVDDLAVLAAAVKLSGPELEAFRAWQRSGGANVAEVNPA